MDEIESALSPGLRASESSSRELLEELLSVGRPSSASSSTSAPSSVVSLSTVEIVEVAGETMSDKDKLAMLEQKLVAAAEVETKLRAELTKLRAEHQGDRHWHGREL